MHKHILKLVVLSLMSISLVACFHDEDEDSDIHGDTPISATIINSGFDTGTINSSTDIDMFSVVCGDGLGTTCSITALTSGSTDTVGRILRIDGSQVAFDDDSGTDQNFTLAVTGLVAGIYYIEVTGFGSVTGDYRVVVSVL